MSFFRSLYPKKITIDPAHMTPGDEVLFSRLVGRNDLLEPGDLSKRKDYLAGELYRCGNFNITFSQTVVRTTDKVRESRLYPCVKKKVRSRYTWDVVTSRTLGEGGNAVVFQGAGYLTRVDRYHVQHMPQETAVKQFKDTPSATKDRIILENVFSHTLDPEVKPVTFPKENRRTVRSWMVMPFYKGITLQALLEKDNLTIEQRYHLSVNLWKALQKHHENKICHRDIKDDNIIVDPETMEVHLYDQGLSEYAPRTDFTFLSYRGSRLFMAPEVRHLINFTFSRELGAPGLPSDVYSMGLLLRMIWKDGVWNDVLKNKITTQWFLDLLKGREDKAGIYGVIALPESIASALSPGDRKKLENLLCGATAYYPGKRLRVGDVKILLDEMDLKKTLPAEIELVERKNEEKATEEFKGLEGVSKKIQLIVADENPREQVSGYFEKLELSDQENATLLHHSMNELHKCACDPDQKKFLLGYLSQLTQARINGDIPSGDYSNTIELTQRLLFRAKNNNTHPAYAANEKRCEQLATSIYSGRKVWGYGFAGVVLAMLGVVLVAAAVTGLVASFGTPVAVVGALGVLGIKVSATAVTAAIGVSGAGATLTLATGAAAAGTFWGGMIAGYGAALGGSYLLFHLKKLARPKYAESARQFLTQSKTGLKPGQ